MSLLKDSGNQIDNFENPKIRILDFVSRSDAGSHRNLFDFLARVLRPGRPIPPDLRNYATQIPDMGASTCAVVDFESTDSG